MISIPAILLGRRGLLIVAVAIAAALLFFVAVPLFAAFEAQREERNDAMAQFSSLRAEVASRPEVQRSLAATRIEAAGMRGLMRSPTAALAEAELQSEIKQIAESNGGDLRSVQSLSPNRANGFDRVALQCDLTLPTARLKDLFYAVEAHQPYYFIDHAEISGPITWQAQGGKPAASLLEVRWTIHAYRWVQPA